MQQSLGHRYEGPIYEVHLKGYERAWQLLSQWRSGPNKRYAHFLRGTERVPILGAVKLDLSPRENGRINGVLYLLTDEELLSIDERERGYQRVDVTDEIVSFKNIIWEKMLERH
jgi:hypothetical protein